MEKLTVLYEDNHIVVVVKPHNVPTQADESGDKDMLTIVKEYVKEKYNKEGEAYIGLVHRLDRPTGGVMVFARTSKAASRLCDQFKEKTMNKVYYAVTTKVPQAKQDHLVHHLKKDEKENIVKIVTMAEKDCKKAELDYKVLQVEGDSALLEVKPLTGRGHQIRVQLAGINCPLFGDNKYGKDKTKASKTLGLWAGRLEFTHPTTKQKMTFACPPDTSKKPWSDFYMDKYFIR
ncbi:MAG: RNA pseudouridine synthase [Clostridia bacterium]|nr:RNA pseudouridine synthase [Clostridia bacterium]